MFLASSASTLERFAVEFCSWSNHPISCFSIDLNVRDRILLVRLSPDTVKHKCCWKMLAYETPWKCLMAYNIPAKSFQVQTQCPRQWKLQPMDGISQKDWVPWVLLWTVGTWWTTWGRLCHWSQPLHSQAWSESSLWSSSEAFSAGKVWKSSRLHAYGNDVPV